MRDDAFYAQEQWTFSKLTLQGGLRFDHAWSYSPPQQEGPTVFLPTPLIYPETPGVDSYKDITPRVAATYDLFGNGKTAIKANIGKYLESTITASNYGIQPDVAHHLERHAQLDRRQRHQVADCDLLNSAAQDPRSRRRLRRLLNLNFGKSVFSNTIDPHPPAGACARPTGLRRLGQRKCAEGVIEIGYVPVVQGFAVTDNSR
jgi:hypothetical protein